MNAKVQKSESAPMQIREAVSSAEERSNRSLLREVLAGSGRPGHDAAKAGGYSFLNAMSDTEALKAWFCGELPSASEIVDALSEAIVQIDEWVSDQVNEVLHHQRFQKLEASWRGLHYLWRTRNDLVEESDRRQRSKLDISVLNISLNELQLDFRRAIEFDQSLLFRRIYTEGLDQAGANPMGMLIADYEFSPWPNRDFPFDGISILKSLSGVAAASFCPLVSSASPKFFELESFEGLERVDFSAVFDPQRNEQYIKWKALRGSEDSRFLGLTLPRVLVRRPWNGDPNGAKSFRFDEHHRKSNRSGYLWGNAAYAFGEVVMRAFAQTGWLANIRGVSRSSEANGFVRGLPSYTDRTEKHIQVPTPSVEIIIPDSLERSIASFGFIPLCHCHDTNLAAFYSNASVQEPKSYGRDELATMNARMSSMLQYILCVSQFARYVKVMAREKIGAFVSTDECERFLHDWLVRYVADDSSASIETRANRPLREASVAVKERPGSPGVYDCEIFLRPHYELDDLAAGVKLKTELRNSSV